MRSRNYSPAAKSGMPGSRARDAGAAGFEARNDLAASRPFFAVGAGPGRSVGARAIRTAPC